MKPKHRVLRTFEDISFESTLPPLPEDTFEIHPANDLEDFFISSAEKHGIFEEDKEEHWDMY